MKYLCTLVLFTFLPHVFSYHQFHLDPSPGLRKYINFDNFDLTRRRGRQVPQFDGWDWDEPSRPLNNRPSKTSRQPTEDTGDFIFEDDFNSRSNWRTTRRPSQWNTRRTTQWRPTERPVRTSTVPIPGMGTPRTPCEDRCLTTPEYNPVCGDDDMTYFSKSRLTCAQRCGKRVKIKHLGACSIIPPRG